MSIRMGRRSGSTIKMTMAMNKKCFTASMEYKGTNSFVTNMVGNLNAVYANGGNTMMDVLIDSEEVL